MTATTTARNAVMITFALNGFGFASWVSRIPEARRELELTNSGLGLLLLAISVGSIITLASSGWLIERWGAAPVVRLGVVLDSLGLVAAVVGIAALSDVWVTAGGLLVYGIGVGVWDVAMNVEGAEVERALGRTIMPRFHAAFSLGTVAGAVLGALTIGGGVPITGHLGAVAAVLLLGGLWTTWRFLPGTGRAQDGSAGSGSVWRAWLEPRTLLIGLMVLSLALTEGTANDWLALALIDGYGLEEWVGVAGFALFVASMTLGRVIGPNLLDRSGRLPVLWGTMAAAALGVVLIAFGGHLLLAALGVVLWGVGASLGFPVGMSAASDDPVRGAARVGVVSTIGYTAFLTGPPLVGFIADRLSPLLAILVVSVVLIPSALVVPAAREPADRGADPH